jgi:hypothetical protein
MGRWRSRLPLERYYEDSHALGYGEDGQCGFDICIPNGLLRHTHICIMFWHVLHGW